MLLRGA